VPRFAEPCDSLLRQQPVFGYFIQQDLIIYRSIF